MSKSKRNIVTELGDQRVCWVCGVSLAGHYSSAVVCSPVCRVTGSRLMKRERAVGTPEEVLQEIMREAAGELWTVAEMKGGK